MPVQAIDNYSDFVEEWSAGVIVVLAERKEDSTFAISRHRAVDEQTTSRAQACAQPRSRGTGWSRGPRTEAHKPMRTYVNRN